MCTKNHTTASSYTVGSCDKLLVRADLYLVKIGRTIPVSKMYRPVLDKIAISIYNRKMITLPVNSYKNLHTSLKPSLIFFISKIVFSAVSFAFSDPSFKIFINSLSSLRYCFILSEIGHIFSTNNSDNLLLKTEKFLP